PTVDKGRGKPASSARRSPDAGHGTPLHHGVILDGHRAHTTAPWAAQVYGAPVTDRTTPVRFAGGPWHGHRARYVHVRDLTPMPCTGGRYCFRELEPDGTVVYAFAAG